MPVTLLTQLSQILDSDPALAPESLQAVVEIFNVFTKILTAEHGEALSHELTEQLVDLVIEATSRWYVRSPMPPHVPHVPPSDKNAIFPYTLVNRSSGCFSVSVRTHRDCRRRPGHC